MGSYGMSDEVRLLRERVRKFIDGEVFAAESELEAEEHEPAARGAGTMAQLKARAKEQGLWALGHPVEIGGQGIPFMVRRCRASSCRASSYSNNLTNQ